MVCGVWGEDGVGGEIEGLEGSGGIGGLKGECGGVYDVGGGCWTKGLGGGWILTLEGDV